MVKYSSKKFQRLTSDHFDGACFFNPSVTVPTLYEVLQWRMTSKRPPWPKQRNILPSKNLKERVKGNELCVTFVNHSTMLIQWMNFNILTDPVWSERVGPFGVIGPKRVHSPGIRFEDLPSIDLIFLSHNHYDHMDLDVLKKLSVKFNPKIITGLGNASILDSQGVNNVSECDWWQSIEVPGLGSVVFTPAQHFSGRRIYDFGRSLWGGFGIICGDDFVYYSGDTGYFNGFKEIRAKFGSPRVAFLPIGAYEPRWFMKRMHMSPGDAVQAHLDLNAVISIAMHYGTFHLSDEGIDDPKETLLRELRDSGVDEETFLVLSPGETRLV